MDEKEIKEVQDRYTPIDMDEIKKIEELLKKYIPLSIALESTIKNAESFKGDVEFESIIYFTFMTGFYYANVYAQELKDKANNN